MVEPNIGLPRINCNSFFAPGYGNHASGTHVSRFGLYILGIHYLFSLGMIVKYVKISTFAGCAECARLLCGIVWSPVQENKVEFLHDLDIFCLHCKPTTRRRYGWQVFLGCYSQEFRRTCGKHTASQRIPMCITWALPHMILWGKPAGILGIPERCTFEQLIGGSWIFS